MNIMPAFHFVHFVNSVSPVYPCSRSAKKGSNEKENDSGFLAGIEDSDQIPISASAPLFLSGLRATPIRIGFWKFCRYAGWWGKEKQGVAPFGPEQGMGKGKNKDHSAGNEHGFQIRGEFWRIFLSKSR
jgi:hypothetical protein